MHINGNLERPRNGISLSAPGGGEGRGEVGDSERLTAHLTFHACGAGPFLSPLKGGEDASPTRRDVCMPQRESGGSELALA